MSSKSIKWEYKPDIVPKIKQLNEMNTLPKKIKFWDILIFNKTLLSMESDFGRKGTGMQRNYSESLSFKFEKRAETC